MLPRGAHRDLLEQVVAEVISDAVQVEWLTSANWSAHLRVCSPSGLVGHVLTSPEWQEARFAEPHTSAFILTDGSDLEDAREALQRLARVVNAYVCGNYKIEHTRGLFGTRTTLVINTADGVWRIGRRGAQPPRFTD